MTKKWSWRQLLAMGAVVVGGLGATFEELPEPEPAGTCFGVQPICIGTTPCCRCEVGGINCVWACCR